MFIQICALILSVCLSISFVSAQTSQVATQTHPTTSSPPTLTSQLRKTVALLSVGYSDNGREMVSRGTSFFVLYEDQRFRELGGFLYMVTNRHVASPGVEAGRPFPVLWTKIRMNQRGDGHRSEDEIVSVGQGILRWYFPADDSVDLAVMPSKPDVSKYDYLSIPSSLFATRETVQGSRVSEGDRVVFTGYFYQFPGMKRFEPIIREGTLAMIPDEPMETTLKKPGDLYLAEVHAFGGNSGSPLFINLGGFRNSNVIAVSTDYRLLGVVSGYYEEDVDLTLTVATTYKGTLKQNSGISMILPVDKLKALLDSPALQASRDAQIAAMKPKN